VNAIVARETDVIRAQLRRNGIAIHQGTAHFLDPHTVEVQDGGEGIKLEAAKILIACGNALGQRATEIIHIGQAVLFYGGSVEYFRDMIFNYPTLAEAYKVAALDGLNKL
jgi:pyruvate/2-oxoglutarate dehydrogenase complex dihydrolipoamide dehydrogenase (E3) component